MIGTVLGISIVGTFAFTIAGLISRSWVQMWMAALLSFVVSIIAMFSIGAFIFVITCLQIATVIALRLHAPPLALIAALLVASLVWFLIVPAQTYGADWLGGIGAYQVVGLLALLLTLLPFRPVKSLRR